MEKQEKIELAKEIIKSTAVLSVVTATAIIAPAAVGAVGKLFLEYEKYTESNKWVYRSRARRTINRLEEKGLIITETRGEEILLRITQAGKKWLKHKEIKDLTINRPTKWDGLWRVVTFDIPEDKHDVRDVIRSWFKRLGFARLQQSVWVIPWPCKEQFDLLCAEFKLGHQAILMETKMIAKESALKRIFNIT